ncbi:MAG TPA: glycosyltransferase [Phycisphaerales bacterium]|nr:glycosyltransferase [Phycisphaerales bacterium]
MPIALVIASVVMTCGALGLGAYWGVVFWHVRRAMKTVPTCRDGLRLPRAAELLKQTAPRVCIVVPAHNEAGVVGKLARSLVAQTYPNLSVVFCLDRCTDSTAAEIRHETGGADHVAIVEIKECPERWAGKVNAVRRGVRETAFAREAELLLFTDADTEFDPECVRAAVALLQERNVGMLSLMSTLTCDRWFERIAQVAAGMELMRQYPLVRANVRPGEHRRAFANGQFMLFTRAAYEQLGGHEAVHDAVLEDVALARLSERRGVAGGLLMADGMLTCRMYADYAEFQRGWSRIYMESANRRVKRLRIIGVRARVLGSVLPMLAKGAVLLGALEIVGYGPDALAITTLAAGGLALVIMMAALGWVYTVSRAPVWCIPLYPIGAWQVGGIMLSAARDLVRRVPVRWAGKEYVREAR